MVATYHTPAYCQSMPRLSADDWVNAAVQQMADSGVHAVRVERLAQALGVSKGSFYWHFENRNALLTAMLKFWEDQGTKAIIAQVDAQTELPRTRVRTLAELVFRSSSVELAFEIQVRAWATVEAQAQTVVHAVDKHRVSYVQRLLTQAKVPYPRARAELFYSVLLGDMLRRTYGKKDIDRGQLRILIDDLLGLSG